MLYRILPLFFFFLIAFSQNKASDPFSFYIFNPKSETENPPALKGKVKSIKTVFTIEQPKENPFWGNTEEYVEFRAFDERGNKVEEYILEDKDTIFFALKRFNQKDSVTYSKIKDKRSPIPTDKLIITETFSTYNEKGFLSYITTIKNGVKRNFTYTYNDKQQLVKILGKLDGKVYYTILYEYDHKGNKILEKFTNALEKIKSFTKNYQYNSDNLLTKYIKKNHSGKELAMIEKNYNNGFLVGITESFYEAPNKRINYYTFKYSNNTLSEVTQTQTYYGNDDLYTFVAKFSPNGLLKEDITFSGKVKSVQNNKFYTYNDHNQLVKIEEKILDFITTYTYTPQGNLRSIDEGTQGKTYFQYDAKGNCVEKRTYYEAIKSTYIYKSTITYY